MKINLGCDCAKFRHDMKITCRKTNDLCGHQRYMPCKGWYVLTDGAKDCPVRKEKK